ncbi:hypothetical protein D3C85_1514790 [compost metagenome]
MCMWVMMTSVTASSSIPAPASRLGNCPARGKPGNCPPRPASTRITCSPLRTTSTFNAQSNASGPRNMSLNHAARAAGSALVDMVEVGSGSTPSLITSTSISPTRTA